MNQPNRSSPVLASVPTGALIERLLAVVLPADRRDEFLGDLIEEARERLRCESRARTTLWLWGQALTSLPGLLLLRARRRLGPAERRVPTPPGGVPLSRVEAGRAFQTFLGGSQGRPRRRPLAMAFAVTLHAALLAIGLFWNAFTVEELKVPTLAVPIFFPTIQAPADRPRGNGSKNPTPAKAPRPTRSKTITQPVDRPDPKPAASNDPPVNHEQEGPPGEPGDPGTGEGDCPPGAPCGGKIVELPKLLPPNIGERRCVDCPLPHLPPQISHLMARAELLMKICVNEKGAVTSTSVIRGIDAAADPGVQATVAGWRFSPMEVNGHPVPFCYVSRFVFTSQ
jgi:hypothetical protein